jgi:nucleotide-binding universal stress UspA family protein
MISRMLVPVDGSEQSRKALEFAADLASRYKAEMFLIHVTQPMVADDVFALGAVAIPVNASLDELDEVGQKVLQAAADIVVAAGLKAPTTELSHGDPGRQIVSYAEEQKIDLIVMGTRALGSLSSLLIGSVSHKVNHKAPCTCITVH